MAPQKYSSTKEILSKLDNVSKGIKRRQSLKRIERKRVNEAFTLLSKGVATGRKEIYLEFLQSVHDIVGLYGVVLCAAGLGVSAVFTMKKALRKEVVPRIKEKEDVLFHTCLNSIGSTYKEGGPSSSGSFGHNESLEPEQDASSARETNTSDGKAALTSPYTGDGYELTWEDAKVVVQSDQLVGQIYLIDTYSEKVASFMIVPVSDKLTRHFAMQRSKI